MSKINLFPKCVKCDQYLSVRPIALSSSGYYCGRCITISTIKENASFFHATAYEILAKSTHFPCKNHSFGCKEKILFEQVANHELICPFKTGECPVEQCNVKILFRDILSHYQKYHKEEIVDMKQIYITDSTRDFCENKLIVINLKVYVSAILKKDKLWLGLRSIDTSPEEVYYQLTIKQRNLNVLLVLKPERVIKYSAKTNFEAMVNLDLIKTKSVLGQDLFFSVELTDNASSTPSSKINSLLEELECFVCQEYMVAPIYNCTTGHSLCANCNEKILQCPLCKTQFEGARNFALEKLSQKMMYPHINQSNQNYKRTDLSQNGTLLSESCNTSHQQTPVTPELMVTPRSFINVSTFTRSERTYKRRGVREYPRKAR